MLFYSILRLERGAKSIKCISKTLGISTTTKKCLIWNCVLKIRHQISCQRKTTTSDNWQMVRAVKKNPHFPTQIITSWNITIICINFIMQQENNLKHTAALTRHFIRGNKWKVLDWPTQSTDSPTEKKTKRRTLQNC